MEKEQYFEISPLLTDKYMISMCYMFYKTGKHDQIATMEFFFREHPFRGNFTIWAGLSQVLTWIKNLQFTENDIKEIKHYLPQNEQYTEWLKNFDVKQIKATGIQEGTIVFPKTPLLVLEGPLGYLQLLEAPILNMLNFPTLIATNAARFKTVANGRKVMEFGLRRAQGPNGALMGTLYSYIGGIDATSNVLAGQKFGVPVVGTMGHSYVTSFSGLEDLQKFNTKMGKGDILNETLKIREELNFKNTNDGELASFIAFATEFPQNLVCLIDTYDTLLSGFKNYICVGIAMLRLGYKPKGLRLDSGDLAELSIIIREDLEKYESQLNLEISKNTIIIASDGINERKIREYPSNYKIDALAIGTNLITCQAQPALGMVCKLVQLNGKPVMKLSSSKNKMILPGNKTLFRILKGTINDVETTFDVIGTEEDFIESLQSQVITLYSLYGSFKEVSSKIEEIQELKKVVYSNGELMKGFEFDVKTIRSTVDNQRNAFETYLKSDTEQYQVYLSENLNKKLNLMIEKLSIQ